MNIYRRDKNLMLRKDKDGYIILNGDRAYMLNETAAKVLKLCDGKKNLNDIRDQICIMYNIDECKDIQLDIEEILNQFIDYKLISIIN